MLSRHFANNLLKTLLVCGVSVAWGAVCFAADYTLHVVDPPITNHVVLSDGKLPPACKQTDTIKLRACRGEYEPASFVLTTSKPLEGVRIEAGRLTGPGGQWSQDAVDVRVRKDDPLWTLLVHDDHFLASEPDPTPEDPERTKIVVKGEFHDAAQLQPVTIHNREQFWVTVHVPEHADPATYEATHG